MVPERGGKLFHAIVGLGLAAGCGGDVTTASGDAGLDSKPAHARDAAQERTSVADVGIPPELDAATPSDATMSVDADAARDAAKDVTIPSPPEIK